MRDLHGLRLYCLPQILKEYGYSASFFNGYNASFDNKKYFFPKIGFDQVYCREKLIKESPESDRDFVWGVSDNFVLESMLKHLDQAQSPFFSFFMSVNTHPPYDIIDERVKSDKLSNRDQALASTDIQLKDFFYKARKKKWFQNTIFIFTADNGTSSGKDKSLNKSEDEYYASLHHIPFFIYTPNPEMKQLFKGKNKKLAGQVDFAPTILDLLNIENHRHPFLGESLFSKNRRDYVYIYRYYSRHYFIHKDGVSELNKAKGLEDFKGIQRLSGAMLFNNLFWPSK